MVILYYQKCKKNQVQHSFPCSTHLAPSFVNPLKTEEVRASESDGVKLVKGVCKIRQYVNPKGPSAKGVLSWIRVYVGPINHSRDHGGITTGCLLLE